MTEGQEKGKKEGRKENHSNASGVYATKAVNPLYCCYSNRWITNTYGRFWPTPIFVDTSETIKFVHLKKKKSY